MQTTLLIILDGWGNGRDYPGNAIKQASTPTWDSLISGKYPTSELIACGEEVGLPKGQMGNSEVGHSIIGAGRIIYQTLNRINRAIADSSIKENPSLQDFIAHVKSKQGDTDARVHIMGLLSDGGVHSHQDHLVTMIEIMAQRNVQNLMLHLFMDGRDTPPQAGHKYIQELQAKIKDLKAAKIASICGRYYAMDRDNRWERTKEAYDLMTGKIATGIDDSTDNDLLDAISKSYNEGITDEFIKPHSTAANSHLRQGDFLVSVNFRADRIRQLMRAFCDETFAEFDRDFILPHSSVLTMTDYDPSLPLPYVFGKEAITNGLGEVLSKAGQKQLRLAETEKFPHVTYFFNGGQEQAFSGEDRKLIASLKVATYDLAPEMRAAEITDELVKAIASKKYGFILCNYANGDMVGHCGVMAAAVKAAEAIDESLSKLLTAIKRYGAQALITADHGNCEEMFVGESPPFKPHTAHTLNPVPLVYVSGKHYKDNSEKQSPQLSLQNGGLADLAPTVLNLMGIAIPEEMTGKVLIDTADTN